jgi:hypothetical protein
MMSKKGQRSVPIEFNPLWRCLDNACEQFHRDYIYYGYGEAEDFVVALGSLKAEGLLEASILKFQNVLVRLIANECHVNSYIQESLVAVYQRTEEIVNWMQHPRSTAKCGAMADHLFYQMVQFERQLESSLQRGPVRFGFLKSRKFCHWDVVVVLRYAYSLIWCSRPRKFCLAPIETETLSVLYQVRRLSKASNGQGLSRVIRDLETVYWATRESDIASLIFVSASLTFLASLVFTIAWIFSIRALTMFAFLSAAVSTVGAVLAMFHLFRKFFILLGLLAVLRRKHRAADGRQDTGLILVRNVTAVQLLLTLARFTSATAAAVALALAVAQNGYGDKIKTPDRLPFWIAMGAFFTSVGSSVFFFIVDFVVRYKLTTELGPFVCSIFRTEIMEIHSTFVRSPKNSVTSSYVNDMETWEYTARSFLHAYRFDTVFAADRFGQILQFLQAGKMDAVRDS